MTGARGESLRNFLVIRGESKDNKRSTRALPRPRLLTNSPTSWEVRHLG
jgi:hypothetical protein